jgi:hypothetical protein
VVADRVIFVLFEVVGGEGNDGVCGSGFSLYGSSVLCGGFCVRICLGSLMCIRFLLLQ